MLVLYSPSQTNVSASMNHGEHAIPSIPAPHSQVFMTESSRSKTYATTIDIVRAMQDDPFSRFSLLIME